MLDAKIVTNEAKLKKLARSPRFHSVKHVSESMLVVYLVKEKAYFCKPYAVGFT